MVCLEFRENIKMLAVPTNDICEQKKYFIHLIRTSLSIYCVIYLQSEYTVYNMLDVTSSLIGIIFLSVEHMAYFGDLKMLPLNTKPLHILTVKGWISFLLITITQLLIRMYNRYTRYSFLLSLIQYTSDLIIAVHFLPSGFLWSNTLSVTSVGLLGVISSGIALYKCVNNYNNN